MLLQVNYQLHNTSRSEAQRPQMLKYLPASHTDNSAVPERQFLIIIQLLHVHYSKICKTVLINYFSLTVKLSHLEHPYQRQPCHWLLDCKHYWHKRHRLSLLWWLLNSLQRRNLLSYGCLFHLNFP